MPLFPQPKVLSQRELAEPGPDTLTRGTQQLDDQVDLLHLHLALH